MNYSKYCNKNIECLKAVRGRKLGIFNPLVITRVQIQSHRNKNQMNRRSIRFNMNFSSSFSFLFFIFFSLFSSFVREEVF